MSPNKYYKCVYCNCVYSLDDTYKHDVCKDFYNFTLEEVIKKLEKQLKICYKIRNKNIK